MSLFQGKGVAVAATKARVPAQQTIVSKRNETDNCLRKNSKEYGKNKQELSFHKTSEIRSHSRGKNSF